MILFIFEGARREPALFKTLNKVFLKLEDEEAIVCSYRNNIHNLYKKMKEFGEDVDIVSIMKDIGSLKTDSNSADFSEIYLFFDYDIHDHAASVKGLNRRLGKMLRYFDNETENGKLYINYPMIESIYYTKELPDTDYKDYTVKIDQCHENGGFKRLASKFSFYSNFDFIQFDFTQPIPEGKEVSVATNWQMLKQQNVMKANYICTGNYAFPRKKEDIVQSRIFEKHCSKYVNKGQNNIAILNAFPLFLYEYLKSDS
ncbi:MAG: hypothetical protein LBV32_01470 [Tannerellaceae bacterium]|jgi:hypothetical protein|nr:hypothetical protein [Tannerellaceae bacterium]